MARRGVSGDLARRLATRHWFERIFFLKRREPNLHRQFLNLIPWKRSNYDCSNNRGSTYVIARQHLPDRVDQKPANYLHVAVSGRDPRRAWGVAVGVPHPHPPHPQPHPPLAPRRDGSVSGCHFLLVAAICCFVVNACR
ncbi:unnamed protein product, partial [Iphiclides podalirius]